MEYAYCMVVLVYFQLSPLPCFHSSVLNESPDRLLTDLRHDEKLLLANCLVKKYHPIYEVGPYDHYECGDMGPL